MKSFLLRTAAVAMGLALLPLIEAAVAGALPPAAAALLPVALLATGRVFRAALRPVQRRARPRGGAGRTVPAPVRRPASLAGRRVA